MPSPLDQLVSQLRARGDLPADRLSRGLERLVQSTQLGQGPTADLHGRLPTGLADLDQALGGGYPRGAITELTGPLGAGALSLARACAAAATREGHLVAWLDPGFSFDPDGAIEGGASLDRLCWLRPRGASQALQACDLALDSGVFSLVVLDLALEDPRGPRGPRPRGRPAQGAPRARPLTATATWARLAGRLREHPAALLVLATTSLCGPQAATTLELAALPARLQPVGACGGEAPGTHAPRGPAPGDPARPPRAPTEGAPPRRQLLAARRTQVHLRRHRGPRRDRPLELELELNRVR